MTKTTTRCNRCDSEVSFKKEHISNDDYYCACLECDEDLFKFETYEDKGENKMKDYLKIVENNNDLVVIKVKDLTNLQIAQKPCFDSSMDYITITRGVKQVLTVINKKGGTFSFHWGVGGYTLISENLKRLKNEVLSFLEENDIFIKLINNQLPLVAKSFKNNNFDKWQFRLGDTDENSHNLFFDTEEQLKDKANKLGYEISRIVPNQYVGEVAHYERRK